MREDSACSACYAALVRGLYVTQEEGSSVKQDIAIGQGWRGKRFAGLGAGNCCAGAQRYAGGCPPAATDVARLFRGR